MVIETWTYVYTVICMVKKLFKRFGEKVEIAFVFWWSQILEKKQNKDVFSNVALIKKSISRFSKNIVFAKISLEACESLYAFISNSTISSILQNLIKICKTKI